MATDVARPPFYHAPALSPSFSPATASAQSSSANSDRPSELPGTWQLPPKPKPGRKPNNDVPVDKKRASNRSAQRKFRERKKQKVEHLQEEMERVRAQHRQDAVDNAARTMRAEQLARDQRAHYERELQNAREAEACARRALLVQKQGSPTSLGPTSPPTPPSADGSHQHQSFNISSQRSLSHSASTDLNVSVPRPTFNRSSTSSVISPGSILPHVGDHSVPPSSSLPLPDEGNGEIRAHPYVENLIRNLPPPNQRPPDQYRNAAAIQQASKNADQMEIDFTTQRPAREEGDAEQPEIPSAERCGFCNDGTYCVCKESTGVTLAPLEPPATASGPQSILPGTCDSCKRDPEQRRICMDIADRHPPTVEWRGSRLGANRTSVDAASPTGRGNAIGRLEGLSIEAGRAAGETKSCADAISMARNGDRHFAERPDYDQWLDSVRTAPPQPDRECNTCNDKNCSAQDVEVASIMEALRHERRFDDERTNE